MNRRYLFGEIMKMALERNKMAFISGPRQVGKTTLAKQFKSEFEQSSYRNWDETEFRRLWIKSPGKVKEDFDLLKIRDRKLLILDEIHKSKGWKQKIKGLFDELSTDLSIVVTGSARLNVFKKGGDSLMGRYLNFRLHPLSYGELTNKAILDPEKWKERVFVKPKVSQNQDILMRLFKFSGFPEPYYAESEKILRVWQRGRVEKIIREDLRDISRLPELSQVEMLASLLPTKIGSPLSIQSLKEDLEVAHDTVKRWLTYLNELYYFFELKPWNKSIPRSLKKEGKIYLYDWTEIEEPGPRFENMIASHLLKACHFWTDTGEGNFDLCYLRNKEKQELDFVIIKNKKPWLCIEAKYADASIDHKTFDRFISYLGCPVVQVVSSEGLWRLDGQKLVSSASYFLSGLP